MKRSMKRIILIVFLLLPFLRDLDAKSFLWEVDARSGKSYILGSIHMLKQSVYPLKSELEKAFESCEFLVVEADISPPKMGEVLKVTMDKSIYKDNSKLVDHISPETYKLAKKKLKDLNMSIDNFENFKPWFLAMSVTSLEIIKLGFDPEIGVDKYFLNKAVGKTILELEGVSYQIDLFDKLSDKENDSFLVSSLKEADSLKNNIDSMVNAWQNGDIEKITEIVLKDKTDSMGLNTLYNTIITKRNKAMSGKIEKMLKKGGRYFIIVGAAHLVGEEGILHILGEKGFKLKQL